MKYRRRITIRSYQKEIIGRLDFGAPVIGSLVLCRIDGRRICERRLGGESSASLPTGLGAGNYVAMVRGTVNQSRTITIYN